MPVRVRSRSRYRPAGYVSPPLVRSMNGTKSRFRSAAPSSTNAPSVQRLAAHAELERADVPHLATLARRGRHLDSDALGRRRAAPPERDRTAPAEKYASGSKRRALVGRHRRIGLEKGLVLGRAERLHVAQKIRLVIGRRRRAGHRGREHEREPQRFTYQDMPQRHREHRAGQPGRADSLTTGGEAAAVRRRKAGMRPSSTGSSPPVSSHTAAARPVSLAS